MKTFLVYGAAALALTSSAFAIATNVGSSVLGTTDAFTISDVSRGNTADFGLYADAPQGSGFAFALGKSGVQPNAFIFYTEDLGINTTEERRVPGWVTPNQSPNLTGVTLGDIETLSVYTRNGRNLASNGVSAQMRFAILTASGWFVSSSTFENEVAGWNDLNTLSVAGSSWIGNVFTPDVDLDDDISGTGTSLAATTEILGYGFYADTNSFVGSDSRIRIDSYGVTLTTGQPYYQHFLNIPGAGGGDLPTEDYNWDVQAAVVPEPSTVALIGLGGLALFVALRRRR